MWVSGEICVEQKQPGTSIEYYQGATISNGRSDCQIWRNGGKVSVHIYGGVTIEKEIYPGLLGYSCRGTMFSPFCT